MAIYNLTSISNCYAYGKIDSSITCILNELSERFGIVKRKKPILGRKKHRQNLLNSQPLNKKGGAVVIFNGDCGFMGKPLEDVIDMLCRYNDMFSSENIHIFFVRGGDEDPSWFNSEKISLSNIECIEDYSMILTKNINLLCIGGSVSIDKIWKDSKCDNSTVLSKSAVPIYDENKLSKVVSSHYPHVIITPNAPTFVSPYVTDIVSNNWLKQKHDVIKEMWDSRMANDKIYTYLTADCTSLPYIWLYKRSGTCVIDSNTMLNGMLFSPMPNAQISNISSLLENNFGVNLAKLDKNSIIPNEPSTSGSSKWNKSLNGFFDMTDITIERDDDTFNEMLMNALGGQEENGDEE